MGIVLYSTNCGKCQILADELNSKNIKYEVCKDTNKMLSLGMKTAPGLHVGNKLMGFGEAMAYVKTLS